MSVTLFDLTYDVAAELGIVTEGTATGGTTSTIIDTNDRIEDVDYWNRCTAWILYDAGGASAAPEGEYGVISTWDKATNTATLRSALTAAPASGDRYAFGYLRYPLDMLIQGVNRAIRDLPSIPFTDTSTITTAGNQTEYDMPIAANLDLRQVWIATNSGDSDHNLWRPVHNAYSQPTDIGSASKLVFMDQPSHPYSVKLEYMASHPALNVYNDKLAEDVHKQRIVFRACQRVLESYRHKTQMSDDWLVEAIKNYKDEADRMDDRFPIRVIPRRGKLMIISDKRRIYPGDQTPR